MNMEFENMLNLPTVETYSVNTANIQELYANGIEETLKNAIQEEFGNSVGKIEIEYDEKYENIEKIELQIQENGVSKIEKVEIGNQAESTKNNMDYENIKNYIAENYQVDKNKIFIN